MRNHFTVRGLLLPVLLLTGCASGSEAPTFDEPQASPAPTPAPTTTSAVVLPLVSPPVRAAVPSGFAGASSKGFGKDEPKAARGLDASDMKSRFFTEGPTSIFRLLALVDGSITEINTRLAAGEAACLTTAPVAYTLAPFGESVPFFAQCQTASASGFVQFGQQNGSTFFYSNAGAGPVAVQVTPSSSGGTKVHAWMAVADGKATGGSYGVMELLADSDAHTFELAVAGRGFGYCGAQLKSDGTDVYELGSADMGSTCDDPATLCVAASDVVTPGTCGNDITRFALAPLGRTGSNGVTGYISPSGYPGFRVNRVRLDGSATDSTSFGPTAPTAGVGTLGR